MSSTACAPESVTADDAGKAAGIFISGSSTVEPISAANAEKFSSLNPDLAIKVEGPGTGDGFEIFCSGESDISDASRPIKPEEIAKCEQNGIEFIELKVAIDGLSVVTSPENEFIDCLSFLDLYALIGPESIGFDQWSDANRLARKLRPLEDEFGDLHAPYPDERLRVTAPGEESGTFDSFVEIVLEPIAEERGEEPTTRPDYQASPNDNVIVEGISGSDTALGWLGFSFFSDHRARLKPIAIDAGDGCVEPTVETIADGSFPIARPLFIYVNRQRAERNEDLAAFVDFYLSEEGLETVEEVGYVQLPADEIAATKARWQNREAGSVAGE